MTSASTWDLRSNDSPRARARTRTRARGSKLRLVGPLIPNPKFGGGFFSVLRKPLCKKSYLEKYLESSLNSGSQRRFSRGAWKMVEVYFKFTLLQ